jgi:putative oxidoreductase
MAIDTRAPGTAPSALEDSGKLVLRLVLGLLLIAHGVSKLGGSPTFGFVAGVVTKAGLPPAFAYLVFLGELIAPLFIVVGLFTRPAALVVTINMLFVLGLVHMNELFSIAPTGGLAVELQFMYLFASIAVALLGAGRFSVGGVAGRWN